MKRVISCKGFDGSMVKTWNDVKEMLAKTIHAYVECNGEYYNCTLTKTGRLRKDKVRIASR